MIIFLALWGLYGVGFITYSLVTKCAYFAPFYVLDEAATFKDFVWMGGVVHIALWLLAIWGILSLLLIPKYLMYDDSVYNNILIGLFVTAQIIVLIALLFLLKDEHIVGRIILHIVAIIVVAVITCPLLLGAWDELDYLIFVGIVALIVSFLLFLGVWLTKTHPIIAMLLFLVTVVGVVSLFGEETYKYYVIKVKD